MPERIVLIGYGPVGARFVDELLPAVRRGDIALTVLGAEEYAAYNRVLIAEYAVGRASRESLDIADVDAVRAAGVDLRLGTAAVNIDRARRVVRLSAAPGEPATAGERLPYDRLVMATGARANVPTLAGMERTRRDRRVRALTPERLDSAADPLPRGVIALRDLADAEVARTAVQSGQRVVVLGAGVLGMEVALAASENGADVVTVYHGDYPMARNLDQGGGRMLARAARGVAVEMVSHARAESVLLKTDKDGRETFDALVCSDGKQIHGDLLLLSCGVGARTELAFAADLDLSTGILVDDDLRSWTDPAIYAIGDCAHVAARGSAEPGRVPGGPSGLIGPGWRQADWLAAAIVAEVTGSEGPAEPYRDNRPTVVMLKADGIDIVSGGDVSADLWDEMEPSVIPKGLGTESPHAPHCAGRGKEVTVWADPARGSYLKMVTVDGVLAGFVAAGAPRAGAELTMLFERGSELPADRGALLRLDSPDADVLSTGDPFAPDATVCWCNGVTVEAISSAISAGNDTIECVGSATRAGTGCGGCKGRIGELIARTPVGAG